MAKTASPWLVVLALLLTGCAGAGPTMAELQDRPIDRTWRSSGSPGAVTQCVQDRIDQESGAFNSLAYLPTQMEERDGGWRLVARAQAQYPAFIVGARPAAGGSQVELRAWGSWPEHIGPVIDRCVKSP
ncbi:MAG TPA: hypothetical protein VIG37_21455 [Methylomirabilota bacterium]